MKAEHEVRHLLRVAYETQKQTAELSAQLNGHLSNEMLTTISGYIQGLQRAAGEIATLAGDSHEEVERLDAEIRESVFKPVQG